MFFYNLKLRAFILKQKRDHFVFVFQKYFFSALIKITKNCKNNRVQINYTF